MDFLIWKYWDKNALSNNEIHEKNYHFFTYPVTRRGEKSFYLLKVWKTENAKFAKEWQKT